MLAVNMLSLIFQTYRMSKFHTTKICAEIFLTENKPERIFITSCISSHLALNQTFQPTFPVFVTQLEAAILGHILLYFPLRATSSGVVNSYCHFVALHFHVNHFLCTHNSTSFLTQQHILNFILVMHNCHKE